MDFRRIPFQFSTTDPLKRQEELQRRFGLPANKGNMYVDFANSGAMGTRSDTSSASNSPRLQHRVPIFVEGQSEPTRPSVDAQNVDTGRKPHVRVIPIEIVGEDNTSKRQRWLSGSSEPMKERINCTSVPVETIKHPIKDPSAQSQKAPRVCNIPIKIVGSDHVIQPKSPVKIQKAKIPESPKHAGVKLNGCSASKVSKLNEKKESSKANERKESPEELILKKILNVEEKLKGYQADVEKFSGTNKEKQYRYLDEMLTRCMLELDEIDTMGLDTIRLARKAAVKKVQASIDLLESKIIKEESKQDQSLKEPMDVETSVDQLTENTETGDASVEVTNVLPEQISEKVENISIMETEETAKPDESTIENGEKMNIDVTEPVQITEIESEIDNIAASESEPIVEEPVSDSKDENAVDMDLDSNNCENDLKFDKPSSVQISEVENVVSDSDNLEASATEQVDQNIEKEIPISTEQTVLSNDNIQVKVADGKTSAAEQSITSIDSNNDC